MKRIEINIPLEAYTDSVRIIATGVLREHYSGGAWEAIKDPATPLKDLENALKILEERNKSEEKRRIEEIKKEIERRNNAQKEKARWWHPFRSEKEGREFIHRWNGVNREIKKEMQRQLPTT